MATENVGAQVRPGGDHLLIPVSTQPAYATIRGNGNGVSKVKYGSLR
jgi:hypothetical protein